MTDFLTQLAHLLPWVPVVATVCLLYLVVNDALDVLLVAKARGNGSVVIGLTRIRLHDAFVAVAADAWNRNAAVLVVGVVVTAHEAGGDFQAQLVSGLVALSVANVGNLEASSINKLKRLFGGEIPPLEPIGGSIRA